MEFDSKEELYFSWWLDELVSKGEIYPYDRGIPFNLSGRVDRYKLREHEYTPDFMFIWKNMDGWGKLNDYGIYVGDQGQSIIEIKPIFDQNNMTRLFKLNQKWVYDKYKAYVQLVVPEKLFSKTFCPERYRYTDGGKSMRKLNKQYLTLDEYIHRTREERPSRVNRKRI